MQQQVVQKYHLARLGGKMLPLGSVEACHGGFIRKNAIRAHAWGNHRQSRAAELYKQVVICPHSLSLNLLIHHSCSRLSVTSLAAHAAVVAAADCLHAAVTDGGAVQGKPSHNGRVMV